MIDNLGEDYCRWMKRGMDAAGTSEYIFGRDMVHGMRANGRRQRESVRRNRRFRERDKNGWRRVDVSLMYVGGGEERTQHNLRNPR